MDSSKKKTVQVSSMGKVPIEEVVVEVNKTKEEIILEEDQEEVLGKEDSKENPSNTQ